MKLIMENWRGFVNEKKLPGGAPSKSKLKKVAQILGRPLSKGEVVALDKKFHQTFPIAAQMQVWLAVDPNSRPLLYDDMQKLVSGQEYPARCQNLKRKKSQSQSQSPC